MRLTFLGTGTSQGVPVIACHCRVCRSGDSRDRRLRTSALLEVEGRNILFDIGPDFRQQMLRARMWGIWMQSSSLTPIATMLEDWMI